ncbi:hypothetical protein FQA47_002782 [Oryzias melastigma]|uniref:Uncharacterized protein n=1 Tax=Oryzias melastigma TaxID=30732 RepID=A0A834C051_ORYME|nr:hypothetical protein FQA47_002782 [Oryzias melastigma]
MRTSPSPCYCRRLDQMKIRLWSLFLNFLLGYGYHGNQTLLPRKPETVTMGTRSRIQTAKGLPVFTGSGTSGVVEVSWGHEPVYVPMDLFIQPFTTSDQVCVCVWVCVCVSA